MVRRRLYALSTSLTIKHNTQRIICDAFAKCVTFHCPMRHSNYYITLYVLFRGYRQTLLHTESTYNTEWRMLLLQSLNASITQYNVAVGWSVIARGCRYLLLLLVMTMIVMLAVVGVEVGASPLVPLTQRLMMMMIMSSIDDVHRQPSKY